MSPALMEPTPGTESTPDADARSIQQSLQRVRRRLLLQSFLNVLAFDVTVALGLFAAWIVVARLVDPGWVTLGVFGAFLGVAVIVSALRAFWLNRASLFDTAVYVDGKLELKERVSSALYLGEDSAKDSPYDTYLRRLLEREAASSLKDVRVSEHLPYRLPRMVRWVGVTAAVVVLMAFFFPTFDLFGVDDERKSAVALTKEVDKKKKELRDALRKLETEAEKKKAQETKKLLQLLRQDMAVAKQPEPNNPAKSKPNANKRNDARKQAMVDMTRRQDAIKKALNQNQFKQLKKQLEKMKALNLKNATLTRKLRAALKEGKLDKAKEELAALSDRLNELKKKEKDGGLTKKEKEELQKLADELAQLSKDAKAMNGLSAKLSAASSQMMAGNLGEALEGMELSQEELDALSKLQTDMSMLQQALQLAQLSQEDLANLGKPHKCPNCGKPSNKPGGKPGGT